MKLREGRTGQHSGLRKKAVIDYNVEKLAVKAFTVPKPKKTIKKKVPKKKGEKKIGTPYLVLIKRAIKALVEKNKNKDGKVKGTVSAQSILAYLLKHTPEKSDKRYVKSALASGVSAKVLVKTRNSYRLSSKEAKKQKKATKKKATKKSTTSKKTTKRKSTAKDSKRPTKKAKTTSTTKKTTTKKAKPTTKKTKPTKKAAPKKDAPEKVKKVKKTKAVEGEERGTIAEGDGNAVWQYYDNGWHSYDSGASAILEGVYQEYKINTTIDVRPVHSGSFDYSVDFTALQQRNTKTHTVRNIRRHLEK